MACGAGASRPGRPRSRTSARMARIVVAGDDFFPDTLHRREKNTPAATVDGSVPIDSRRMNLTALGNGDAAGGVERSEEHTSELQSPCISYAVFCLKKK